MTDLTEPERTALMERLHATRDYFAARRPRVAQWCHERLVELADDRRSEQETLAHLELDLAGLSERPVAEIIEDDEGEVA